MTAVRREAGMVEGAKRRGPVGWAKIGCLGCLVVAGGLVALPVVLFLIGSAATRTVPRPENAALEQPLPPPVSGSGAQPATEPPADVPVPGRLLLDLRLGVFMLVAGPAGEPIRVEGVYDAASYDLTQNFTPAGETGWTHEIRFRRMRGWHWSFSRHDAAANRIRIVVPRGVPIRIDGSVGIGESDFDFGGLWLTDLALEIGIGDHRMRCSEPLEQPAEEMIFQGSIGDLEISGLGNASPRFVSIRHGIGNLSANLDGAWSRDAEIMASCVIGDCGLRLPPDVNIDSRSVGVLVGDTDVPSAGRKHLDGRPTLGLSLRGVLGEVRVED